jgi:hypothetical protein
MVKGDSAITDGALQIVCYLSKLGLQFLAGREIFAALNLLGLYPAFCCLKSNNIDSVPSQARAWYGEERG